MLKCPVCGEYEVETYHECPYCSWMLDGAEYDFDEDYVVGGPMGDMSVLQAKELLAQGKNVYGEPLPKK